MHKRSKRRTITHVMEGVSSRILISRLPNEWVFHDYKPDYGIDYSIEIFDKTSEDQKWADTLGEHVFVQLKSIQSYSVEQVVVEDLYNVEKFKLTAVPNGKKRVVEVVKFVIDTPLLYTVQRMGSSPVVLLCLVCIETEDVFYLCLNDYIDKILMPRDGEYTAKKSKTIYIPIRNKIIKGSGHAISVLKFYAKRSKLYSAFLKFHYFNIELKNVNYDDEFLVMNFVKKSLQFDIWSASSSWGVLNMYLDNLKQLYDIMNRREKKVRDIRIEVFRTFNGLDALSSTYEEYCREWWLPSAFALDLSY